MKDNFDTNAGPVQKREPDPAEADGAGRARTGTSANGSPRTNGHAHANGRGASARLDFWVVLEVLRDRWHWLIICALICGAGFYYLGSTFIRTKYTAEAQLLREPPVEFFKAAALTPETFGSILRSPDLLQRVGSNAVPPIAPATLSRSMKIDPQPDSDIVKILLAGPNAQQAVDLINLYSSEAVEYTRELNRNQAAKQAHEYLQQQVDKIERQILAVREQYLGKGPDKSGTNKLADKLNELTGTVNSLRQAGTSARPSRQVAALAERMRTELNTLNDLTRKYKPIHPAVQSQEEVVAEIRKELEKANAATNTTGLFQGLPDEITTSLNSAPGANGADPEAALTQLRLLSMEETRGQLLRNYNEAEMYANDPPAMARVFATANLATVKGNMRSVKITAVTIFGALLGMACSVVLICLVELMDRRVRTGADLNRVTKLPVLTALGNLDRMEPQDKSQWAFRAWTMLQGRLSPTPNHGLICGITSSAPGEGRSTWVSLLAEAASLAGFRVLTIATKPSPTPAPDADEKSEAESDIEPEEEPSEKSEQPDEKLNPRPKEPFFDDSEAKKANRKFSALVSNALTSPAQVAEQLTGPNSRPVVHIPLPGWAWNLERRKQWRDALGEWRNIDNLVILVELPPASVPEAVLLGCNLPNLLWLAQSGTADAAETRVQLETLRDARCNIVGAVLNREPAPSLKHRFPRWIDATALLLALAVCSLQAQDANPVPAAEVTPAVAAPPASAGEDTATKTNLSFSIVHPSQRAEWQRHLTLGPGDILTFSLYGQPEFTRAEVAIAPDGMVNYLEATNVLATGLTIDEFRSKLDKELGQYRRAPRTIITPVAFHSKKYYMLGKVMTKGVYTLDRPITVLEAIARAKGFENGLVDRNIIDLADFQRSFLMRGGKRIPLNFEKLFQDGDLSQNIAIEPDDFLYFPSTHVREVYVVGEVRLPGIVTYTPDATIMAAISARGGYTDRAYKGRVLVVRGSLNNPETFAIDTKAILKGKDPDFQLQAKDIIYVSSRPFILAEELLDLGVTAFIQSFVSSYVGAKWLKPFSTNPIVP